jgi:hypothetical protein
LPEVPESAVVDGLATITWPGVTLPSVATGPETVFEVTRRPFAAVPEIETIPLPTGTMADASPDVSLEDAASLVFVEEALLLHAAKTKQTSGKQDRMDISDS